LNSASSNNLSDCVDQPEISAAQKTLWRVLVGAVAGLLLYVGGVTALQAASIVFGLPIGFVIVAISIDMFKTMRRSGE